jgi:two-component system chemotaxis sensor kinase CheA
VSIDVSQFHEGFFDEVAEHLENLEGLVVAVEAVHATRDDFDALFRAAHSIKGASGTFGFREMAELTHYLESALERAREGSLSVSPVFVDTVLATADVLKAQLDDYRAGRTPDAKRAAEARALLEVLLNSDDAGAALAVPKSAAARLRIDYASSREGDEAASVIAAMKGVLGDYGSVEYEACADNELHCTFEGSRTAAEIWDLFAFILVDGDALEVAETPLAPAADESFGFFDDAPESEGAPADAPHAMPSKNGDDSTVRVKLHKIDTLINLVGELLIAQSSLQERAARFDSVRDADLHEIVDTLQRHTRDIRESVMAVRMLPIGSVFSRFPRMVRELAAELGKDVALETAGGDTELDKSLVESVVDPLTHIIRNSIDHGIESADVRLAAGKPARGTISVRSFQRAGNVVIEVRDDGAGMSRDRILAKCKLLGIPLREHMSDREVWMLVCHPGFSTAAQVTNVSGRGVGMDVVKRNIGAFGGTIEIDSTQGVGTRISLVLPLTLAILDGLAVRSDEDVCIVPLSSIVESIVVTRKDVVRPPDAKPFVLYRGEPLALFAAPGGTLTIEDDRDRIAVVVEADGRKAGLMVDALESEHQVVIKSLEANFRKVDGFSGATVLGNGNVALILDVAALIAR